MQNYKCPHNKIVHREVGDFKTIKERDVFVVECEWDEEVLCNSEKYKVVNYNPFDRNSGIDPRTIEVECLDCGKRSYIMPAPIGKQPKEFKEVIKP